MPLNPVLVLNNLDYFEQFHENLCTALRQLNCWPVVPARWPNKAKELGEFFDLCRLILVDPTMQDFDLDQLRTSLLSCNPVRRPKVIVVRTHPDDDIRSIEERLESESSLVKTYSLHEMVFAFNRCLFPRVQNRRRFPRALATVPVEFRDTRSGFPLKEISFNLSGSGLFIQSYQPQERGSTIDFMIHLPDGQEPIQCRGHVAFSKAFVFAANNLTPAGMGIHIDQIDPKDQLRLRAFVHPRLPRADRIKTERSIVKIVYNREGKRSKSVGE
ncbi:MAG TPA: PilZ domain-containing protein [Bdellovibrionota bacterium]|nr:PilZ domain-containing protein [Bdellovibrionota bacterium]